MHRNRLHHPTTRRLFPEVLSYTISLARTEEQMEKAINLRKNRYSKKLPSIANTLSFKENEDKYPDSIILLAESKETGDAVGTLRIHTNHYGRTEFERELYLPEKYHTKKIAQVGRLAIAAGRYGTNVKMGLFKALYRYCLATQIEWIMATGIPPRHLEYLQLNFEYVYQDKRMVRLESSNNIPAHLLSFNVRTGEQKWRETSHPLYKYMCLDLHEDIKIFDSVSGIWSKNRATLNHAIIPANKRNLNFPII